MVSARTTQAIKPTQSGALTTAIAVAGAAIAKASQSAALATTVSLAGDGWLWYAIIAALPWWGGPTGGSAAARMLGVGTVNLILYKIIKRWIARPRPFRVCQGFRECARSLDEFSFPSGHTLHSVAFSFILTAYYPAFAIFVWPLTLLIAASRIILGLHYPSDVIVGGLIGVTTAAISFNLL